MKIFVYNNVPNIDVTIGELYQQQQHSSRLVTSVPSSVLPSPEIRGHSLQTLDPGRGRLNLDTNQQISGVLCNYRQLQALTMIKIQDVDMHEKYS